MAAIEESGPVSTADASSFTAGWQTSHSCFRTFQGQPHSIQPLCPARGINHSRIPSMMEVCLLMEEYLLVSRLWQPMDKKQFVKTRESASKCEAEMFAQRRRLLLDLSLFVYDFNESLVTNEDTRVRVTLDAISEITTNMDLSHLMPLSILQLICDFTTPPLDSISYEIETGFRKGMSEKDKMRLSDRTKRMLLANQRRENFTEFESKEEEKVEMTECDVSSIRDRSKMPGLFWDLHLYHGGLSEVLNYTQLSSLEQDFHGFRFNSRRDFALIPTPIILPFRRTGNRFVSVNVFVASKGDEMWFGINSLSMSLERWPRNPENGVYYYGGRKRIISDECTRRLDVKSETIHDGCWGNIQHRSKKRASLFSQVHLPYYQSGDWLSFRIDTQQRSMDVWLNNELIICDVDCKSVRMPWLFVSVVDAKQDLVYIEQTTDISGTVCDGFVDGLYYRR